MYVLSSMSSGYSGEVAANGGVQPVGMLTVSKTVYGSLQLAWGDSCVVTDTDFAVYEGSIGNFRSHTPVLCSTGGATTTTVAQPAGNTYYLVVPNDQVYEGRYGSSSSGSETPVGPTRCYPAASTTGCP
jgi:hypothetical protein